MAWDNRNDDDNFMVDRIAGEGALSERSVDLDYLLVRLCMYNSNLVHIGLVEKYDTGNPNCMCRLCMSDPPELRGTAQWEGYYCKSCNTGKVVYSRVATFKKVHY